MIRALNSKNALTVRGAIGLAAAAFLSAAPASAQDTVDEPAAQMTKGEEKLARLLEGRVAGTPQNCIRDFINTRVTTIDDTAYVYGRGRTIYVQRTRNANQIDRDDILVVRRVGSSRLCRTDFIQTIDRYAGFFTGGVQFDQFIPYTRVEDADL